MSRITTAAKVGVFAVVTAGAGYGIYHFISQSRGPGQGYTVWALMDDASGIAKLSQVRIAGIPVGSVRSVRLQDGKARVDMTLQRGIALYDDAAAAKVMSSLLGEYYLTLTPGTDGLRQLRDGDQVKHVVEAATTDEILKEVASIAQDVKRVSESLAEAVGTEEGKEYLKGTLKNLAQVTDALNRTVQENRQAIHDILSHVETITGRGEPEVQQILENVRETTREVRELVAKAPEAGAAPGAERGAEEQETLAQASSGPGEVRQIIDRVNRASQSLETSMRSIEEVTGRLERGEGTLGRLSKDEELIDEVQGVTQTVGEFVGGLNRLQTILNIRADYQFLAGTVKDYIELRLQPREDKYYAIEIVSDPRGLTRLEQSTVETTNPNDPPVYYERRETTTNSFRFSLQFAQRLGPLVGRAGLKESTGGIGLDLLLFQDRFELTQDLFGFGERVLPRWRISLGYEFITRLWLLGGADDILSAGQRDYFVGLQLRFNDQDLKGILPFAPSP
jgi:phospholipid/cholesterol/gamma-HCH transport system substrate-binding protein